MVADAALVARAHEGTAGFQPAEGAVGDQQQGVVEHLFPNGGEAFGKRPVDLFPMPVVLERSPWSTGPQVLVEVADGEGAGRPGGVQRVRQGLQPGAGGRPPPALSGTCFGALPRRGRVDRRQSSAQSMPRWSGDS